MLKTRRSRAASAPPSLRLQCGSVSRERRRESDVRYETGRDRAARSISQWTQEEMCAVLYHLVCRCRQSHLKALYTSLESVPHRDLQLSAVGVVSGLELRPVSTTLSREVRIRLRKSHRPQNRRLYRTQSAVIRDELPLRPSPLPLPSSLTPHLTQTPAMGQRPVLPPSPAHQSHMSPSPHLTIHSPPTPHLTIHSPPTLHLTIHSPPTPHLTSSTVPLRPMTSSGFRPPTTPRRHMMTTPTPYDPLTSRSQSSHMTSELHHLPADATQFLAWFSSLTAVWQQQELLQVIVMNLDPCELYYLAALLISRQYRDPVACLPEPLALHLLSFVPVKDLLRHCSTVSRVWHKRCTSEILWKKLCSLTNLGIPPPKKRVEHVCWRRLFIDSLRMKQNWWRGRCCVRTLHGHTGRVLCVKLRGDIIATGSSDSTVRVWSLESGQCLHVLTGHTKGVWCLCFYGKRLLISGSSDCSIKVWNIETGLCERSVEAAHCGTVWCMQQKREILVTGSHDKTVSACDCHMTCEHAKR